MKAVTNRLLGWIDGKNDAPLSFSPVKLREAGKVLLGRGRAATRRFSVQGGLPAYIEMCCVRDSLYSLVYLGGEIATHAAPRWTNGLRDEAAHIGDLIEKWQMRSWKVGGALAKRAACLKKKVSHETGRAWLTMLDDDLTESGVDPLKRQRLALAKRIENGHTQWTREHVLHGGVAVEQWPENEKLFRGYARKLARKRGLGGYVALPLSQASQLLVTQEKDPDLRKHLWNLSDSNGKLWFTEDDIDVTRAMGRSYARALNMAGLAQQVANGAYLGGAGRARRWLTRRVTALDKALANTLHSVDSACGDDGALARWNMGYAARHIDRPEVNIPATVFPIMSTARKVIREMMGIGGWEVGKVYALGRDARVMLDFRMKNTSNGREARLLYAPYDPYQEPGFPYGGMAIDIRCPLSGTHGDNLVMIKHYLESKKRGMDAYDIELLCHEIGHALHFLAVPGKTVDEIDNVNLDFDEMPSMLAQRYGRDPRALARWAHAGAGKTWHDWRVWRRHLKFGTSDALAHYRHGVTSLLDLKLHGDDDSSTRTIIERTKKSLVNKSLFDGTFALCAYNWDERGGSSINYFIGGALAERMAPRDADGMIRSEDVAVALQRVLTGVIATSVTMNDIQRNWRRTFGESMTESLRCGTLTEEKLWLGVLAKSRQAVRRRKARGARRR